MEDNGVQSTQEETAQMEDVYFGLQAELDMTKHIGALDTTNELLELLHIDSSHNTSWKSAAAWEGLLPTLPRSSAAEWLAWTSVRR